MTNEIQSGEVSVSVQLMNSWLTRAPLLGLVLLMVLALASSASSQGSIAGEVTNSDLSTPADGEISFVGFLDDTDEEIRIETCVGAGYENGYWFDDFQNYQTEAPGNPYDYLFYNASIGEGFHLAKLIPNNSFQIESFVLTPVAWPVAPTGLTVVAVPGPAIRVSWTRVPDLTYHVYRRVAPSLGSFYRIDNPAGRSTGLTTRRAH